MAKLVLFNKPYGVLSQFTDSQGRQTLADYIKQPGIYAAGRLDRDSEGLLLLTADGALAQRITHPRNKLPKTYWVQVEGTPEPQALDQLRQGVELNDGPTRPAKVISIPAPKLWLRENPVRERKNIPTSWLSITISEGRNRQVRRMTASVGLPTLRLVRSAIGQWQLNQLQPGEFIEQQVHLPQASKPKPRPFNKRKKP